MPYNDLISADPLYEGKVATYEPAIVLTATNKANAVIAFGKGVVRGSADGQVIIPTATGQTFMGIAVETNTIEKRAGYSIDANGKMGWPVNYDMSFIRRGIIAVPVDSDCVQGGAVYVIHTAGTGQVPQAITSAQEGPRRLYWADNRPPTHETARPARFTEQRP